MWSKLARYVIEYKYKRNDIIMVQQIIKKYWCSLIVIVLASVMMACGMVLGSARGVAESATASVTVGSACTLTYTVDAAHSAEVPSGTSRQDIGTTTLNTICNDAGGFAIYAVGYSGGEYGNNTMINQSDDTITFNTGTNTSGNSSWAMKLAQVTTGTYATTIDNSFNAYHSVPSTFTKVAHRDSATDAVSTNPAVGTSISLTYQSYISSLQTAGTYEGKVRFTLVHPSTEVPAQPLPAVGGYIVYHPNGGNVVGTMADQAAGDNATKTLYPSNFSRAGYGFAGWSTTYDYSDPAGFYGPNQSITTPADTSTNGLSLYAIWVKSAGNIQNWSGCSSLSSGAVTALKDLRDNNVYAVAKLADGNCWMIENMRLDYTNSDNATGTLAQGYGTSSTYGNFSGLAEPEGLSLFANVTTANSLYSIDGVGSTVNISTQSYPGNRFPRYNNQNTSSRGNNTTNSGNIYSYGNYYTWSAAVADTSVYSVDNQSVENTSICPSGWHLPKGGDKSNEANNEYWKLIVTNINGGTLPANYSSSTYPYYNGTTEGVPVANALGAYPNNFVYSGFIAGNAVKESGYLGQYWSSTKNCGSYAYIMSFSNAFVLYVGYLKYSAYPGTLYLNDTYSGRPIRCLTSGV